MSSASSLNRQKIIRKNLENEVGTLQSAPLLSHDQYTIAWICALPIEMAAAQAMLDKVHRDLPGYPNDTNTYTLGSAENHNIVIVCLPADQYGTNNAANVLTHLVRTFTSIRLGLMVGIGGGAPCKIDVRLGDIVVGTRVIQYDLGKTVGDGQIQHTAIPKCPHLLLSTAVSSLRAKHERYSSRVSFILKERFGGQSQYSRPTLPDCLFFATYEHVSPAHGCDKCDHSNQVLRDKRSTDDPLIHYGGIASGNQVMRSGTERDKIARQLDVICFEMETAGLMDILPCLPIRGICDYSDSHKNKEWQRYAAAAAAAYARELLAVLHVAGAHPKVVSVPYARNPDAPTGSGPQHSTVAAVSQPHRSVPIHVISYPRNEDIVHRRDLINKLNILLPPKPEYYSAALYGLGGSGKTQIALQFAYNRGNDIEHSIFWVHADSEATFTYDYKEIATKLGIGNDVDGEDLLKAVRNGIEARPPWVIILDNADDLALFGIGQPRTAGNRNLYQYIPKAPGGTVLWTSRDARIAGTLVGGQRAIKVPSMTTDEARKLLATTGIQCDNGEERFDDALLAELQYLPLAISQAGAYMLQTSTTVQEYFDLLKRVQDRWNVLKESNFDRHRRPDMPNSILETWWISMERIRQENTMAYEILYVIAYLDSQNLPVELIKSACRVSTAPTSEQVEEPRAVRAAITRLIQFSFISENSTKNQERSYDMHKLVQDATRYGLSMARSAGTVSGADTNEQSTMGRTEEAQYAGIAVQAVSDLFPISSQDTWNACEKYLMHATRVGEWAELCGKQIEVSRLLSRVSGFLYDRGRWWEREPVDLRVLHLREDVLGKKHPDTIWCLGELAATYHQQGRYSEAETLKKEALDLRWEVLGEKHPHTIESMASLAATCGTRGRYNEAESLHETALNLRREVLGEKHPDTIWSMSSLATTYRQQGRYSEAKPLHQEVLDLRREVLGEKHPDTIWSMADLATTCRHQGRYSEAELLHQMALNFRREVHGEKHPRTIRSMADLATTYHQQGRYSEAERIYVQALDLRREVLGRNHPHTIWNIADLATTYHQQGRYSEAEIFMKEALDLGQKVLGEKHPHTIESMVSLAVTFGIQGRYDEAESLHEKALNFRREVLGDKHPDTLRSTQELAAIQHGLHISTSSQPSIKMSVPVVAQGKSRRSTPREIVQGKLRQWKS